MRSLTAATNLRVDSGGLLKGFGRLVDGLTGEVFDFAKITSLVEAKKNSLKGRARRGDFVLLKLSNQVDFFVTLFFCWESQLIPVIMPHRSSALEIENVGRSFGVKAVFSDGGGIELPDYPASLPLPESVRESTALVLLTSGTLGEPKSILLPFAALKEKFSALERAIPLEQRRNTMCFLPLCFGHGLICNSLFPLLTGSTLYIFPTFELSLSADYLAAIGKYKINFFSTVPVILKVLTQCKLPAHELRRVHCASAPLMKSDWIAANRWLGNGVLVTHVYGLTEFSGWVAGSDSHAPLAQGYVGRPWGVEFGAGEVNAPQEIQLRGPSCMSGWIGGGKFHLVERNSWIATGDLGFVDEHGCLTLKGRQKELINYGGFKVYPEDLDQLLAQHPAIKEVCCFALKSENLGEVPAAACVLSKKISEKELKQWCAERIHSNKIPARWFFLSELPRNERGKISRRKIGELCESGDVPVE